MRRKLLRDTIRVLKIAAASNGTVNGAGRPKNEEYRPVGFFVCFFFRWPVRKQRCSLAFLSVRHFSDALCATFTSGLSWCVPGVDWSSEAAKGGRAHLLFALVVWH